LRTIKCVCGGGGSSFIILNARDIVIANKLNYTRLKTWEGFSQCQLFIIFPPCSCFVFVEIF
jgi:hypothetical protein